MVINLRKIKTSKDSMDLDADSEEDNIVQTHFKIPAKMLKDIGLKAIDLHMSKAALVRLAVEQYLYGLPKSTKPDNKLKTTDEELQILVQKSRTFWGTLDTTGNNSIFENFKRYDRKFKNLTESQWIWLCAQLVQAYKGFGERPTVEDFMNWVDECEPTDEQAYMLSLLLENIDNWYIANEDLDKSIEQITSELEQTEKDLKKREVIDKAQRNQRSKPAFYGE